MDTLANPESIDERKNDQDIYNYTMDLSSWEAITMR